MACLTGLSMALKIVVANPPLSRGGFLFFCVRQPKVLNWWITKLTGNFNGRKI